MSAQRVFTAADALVGLGLDLAVGAVIGLERGQHRGGVCALRDGLGDEPGSAVADKLTDFLHRARRIAEGRKNVVDAVGKVCQRVQKGSVQIK